MRYRSTYRFLLIMLVCSFPLAEVFGIQRGSRQKVFTNWGGLGHEIVIDISGGRLRIRKAKVREGEASYLVDGGRYYVDENVIDANYKNHEIGQALTIKDDKMLYDGIPVSFPYGVKMRNVWQAVLWNGWVICLGRTSRTDDSAKLRPPFFATELITFSVQERVARVRWIMFSPPSGTRLFILDPK